MPRPQVPHLFTAWQRTLAAAPGAIALVDAADRAWTRVEIDALASATRASLPPGIARHRVAFALPNGPVWLATFLALLAHDCVAVPLDAAEPPGSQQALASASQALLLSSFPDSASAPALRAPRPALCKLTSGSTGAPRTLAFSHAQMLADGRQVCSSMDIRPDDRNLAVIPFGHSYGLGNLVVPLLAQGTAILCADTPLPHALAVLAARRRPTVFPAVPALLRALAEADLPADAFASVRTVISAGSPLPPSTARAFHARFGLKPHGFYGSSETGGIAYDREGDDTLEGLGVGRALDGVSITPLPGQRVRIRSPAVFRAAGHIPADRARLGPDGRLVLLGRAGRMIKIGGRRLDLGDLEAALRRLPGVADAFAAPHPDDPGQLAAVLATTLAPLPLRALLRQHLAPWKIPRRLVAVPAFPLTPRGKPDPAALRALLAR